MFDFFLSIFAIFLNNKLVLHYPLIVTDEVFVYLLLLFLILL